MWMKYHINLKQKLDKLVFMTGHKHNKPSYITKHLTRYKNKKNLESSERPASTHTHDGSKATQEVFLLKNPFQQKPIGKNLGVGKKSTTLTWHSLRENNKHLESSIYPAVDETEGLTFIKLLLEVNVVLRPHSICT